MIIKSAQGSIQRKVLYAQAVYGDEEKKAVMESLENGWLASGPKVKEFEAKLADLFGKKYGIAVNSGSSGNLLGIQALRIDPGMEVITPACTFATTVSEIINNNLIPVFVDSVVGRYTIDEEEVAGAITPKTKAILVPQLVGGVCDMKRLRDICDDHGLFLIDDSCDTLAPTLHGKTVASYADITTTSFYGSHIITACGMGGMIFTDSEEVRDRIIVLRDWGRVGNDSEDFEKRFDFEIDGIPYDSKFLYSELGYNLKMNEVAAAFGLAQLDRLDGFLKLRRDNFSILSEFFGKYEEYFILPYLIDGAETNWLAYPLSIKEGAPFTRYDFLKHLEQKGIQTRVLFSGNITRHPVYKKNGTRWIGSGDLNDSDYIMAHSFLLGCHNALGKKEIDYVMKSVDEFFHENTLDRR
jgi:CDP-6-deoxy-D-xylo-4-hexulose-3-dehydrase